jgi:beta-glucosidase
MEQRIDALLEQMTLEEKISMTAGVSAEHYMDTTPVERLGIPMAKMADGPHGLRWDRATCFPVGINMGSCWNPELIQRLGKALGEQTQAKGRDLLLGPCINIHRITVGGRNFESFGEDPYLAGRTVVAYVKGVQGVGVGTSTKHFACNNQEHERMTISAEVDERTLREIYLPAFEAAVKEADTWTIMGAYNRLNGTYCCAHDYLLNKVLKDEWDYDGAVISDWGAVHGTEDFANGGLDLEMPGPGKFFNEKLQKAVEEGRVDEKLIDDKVRRLLRLLFRLGLMDDSSRPEGALDTPEHKALAREVGAESMVLLKNDNGMLPFDNAKTKKLAVIGPNAPLARLGGGGSSNVTPFHAVTPLEGLQAACGDDIEVVYAMGCTLPDDLIPLTDTCLKTTFEGKEERGLRGEYFKNSNLEGDPAFERLDREVKFDWGGGSPGPGFKNNDFSIRWTGTLIPNESREYDLGMHTDDRVRIYLDGELFLEHSPKLPCPDARRVYLEAGREYDLRVEYQESKGWAVAKLGWLPAGDLEAEALAAARDADAVVFCGGISAHYEGEGNDRRSMELPGEQNKLIHSLLEVNPNLVVVLYNGGPLILTDWINEVPAVIEAWYPGQEGGHALADVLLGKVNPSGRLPVSFPVKADDAPAAPYYPGGEGKVAYEEGIFIGYRGYDRNDVEPLFAFGHGESFTTFEYSGLVVEKIGDDDNVCRVQLNVTNSGDRDGSEVVQVYVHDPESRLERPLRELKAFEKVFIKAGESAEVEFTLNRRAFQYYDPAKGWVLEPGLFEIQVGRSLRDIRLTASVEL